MRLSEISTLKLARGTHTENKTVRVKEACMKPNQTISCHWVVTLQKIQCSQTTKRIKRERERRRRKPEIHVIGFFKILIMR